MDNITIIDSSNNEVIAVVLKDEVIIKDGYEVLEDVGVEEEGINITKILLDDGRILKLSTPIQEVLNNIDLALEEGHGFLGIDTQGVRRLIRVNDVKEIIEVGEFTPINSNVNVTLNANIDIDELMIRMTEAIIKGMNHSKQGVSYSSQQM